MSDLFTIGSGGVNAYQRALSVVSNNIANVSADGYSRQNVRVEANGMVQRGAIYLGTGARFGSVQRQYDAFIESNLRDSQSALNAQEPLLTYTNRLIDILGDQSIGLTSAMTLFFQSARNLASDASSAVARGVLFRDADGLASRFREMASQMRLIDDETRQNLSVNVAEVNVYTRQLAFLNGQLTKHDSEAKQPAELLDQRDALLSSLSGLIDFNASFNASGQVVVSVGDTISQGVLVNGQVSRDMQVIDSPTEANKVAFLIDPYGDKETVAAVSNGTLGGLVTFRDQVLNPAKDALDSLAGVLVDAVNAYHHTGLDLDGEVGGDMFTIDPAVGGAAGVQMVLISPAKLAASADFRVSDIETNLGSAQALISYGDPSFGAVPSLTDAFETALSDDYLQSVNVTTTTPARVLGSVSAGQKDLVVYLDQASQGQWLEVMTRDGQHLAGAPAGGESMVKASLGMELGATYSDRYLNVDATRSDASYLGMDVFVGAKATSVEVLDFVETTGEKLLLTKPADLLGTYQSASMTEFLDSLPAGVENVFSLNGVMLTRSDAQDGGFANVAEWIDSYQPQTGVSAAMTADGKLNLTLNNAVTQAVNEIGYVGRQLTIGEGSVLVAGQAMPALAANYTLEDVRDWLNRGSLSGPLGFTASIDANGALALSSGDDALLSQIRSAVGIVTGFDTQKIVNGVTMKAYEGATAGVAQTDMTFGDVMNWINQEANVAQTGILAEAQDGQMVLKRDMHALASFVRQDLNYTGQSQTVTSFSGELDDETLDANGDQLTPPTPVSLGALTADYTMYDVLRWLRGDISGADSIDVEDQTPGASSISAWLDNGVLKTNLSADSESALRDALGLQSFDTSRTIYGQDMSSAMDDMATGIDYSGQSRIPTRFGYAAQDVTAADVRDWVNESKLSLHITDDPDNNAWMQGMGFNAELDGQGDLFVSYNLSGYDAKYLYSTDEIRLGFSQADGQQVDGSPADLAMLGLRTGAYIAGRAEDDLVVAVSDFGLVDSGGYSSASVMASYAAPSTADDARQMWRERELNIDFYEDADGGLRYTISDATNGFFNRQVLADRAYTAAQSGIDFRGLSVDFSSRPVAGDQFVIDGNQNGLGNNEVMLKIAGIEDDATILGTGLTITETYIENVNDVGSVARQAGIAQTALSVVKEQAAQAKDAVSGVSLDEEAADLVRFQQAYQANAKVMQVASTLFDAILAVR